MSANLQSPPSSPIENIDDDALMYIFTLNANMIYDKGHALHTTRRTSQVCYRWRSLILSSTATWGKLIALDAFTNSSTHEWWDEVVRRTGSAPLWVMGTAFSFHNTQTSEKINFLFVGFICKNWHRIQKFIVYGNRSIYDVTRSMLCFPAPQLIHFEAELTRNSGEEVTTQDNGPLPIFSNHAPLLRRFDLQGYYIINPCAPWLRHLHSIQLNEQCCVRDAHAILSTTHALQELKINHLVHGDLSISLPIINLPQLKSLHYTGDPEPYSKLFAKVDIPPSCSLKIWVRSPPGETETITGSERTRRLLTAVNIFTRYAEHSIQAHALNTVTMNLGYSPRSYISFSIGNVLMSGCSLNIHISLDGAYTTSIAPTVFFNKLSELDLSL